MQKISRYFLLFFIFSGFTIPLSPAHANGDACDYKLMQPSQKIQHSKSPLKKTSIQKSNTIQPKKPKKYKQVVKKDKPVVKKAKHHEHKSARKAKVVRNVEEFPPPYQGRFEEASSPPKIFTHCREFPIGVVKCYTLNPADIVDFTCGEFSKNIESCKPYTCQAPYAQDPTIKTTWTIVGKQNDRCTISNITDDVGMKDSQGNITPLSQTCEYDEIGIKGLMVRFKDMQERYYHFSTNEHFEGIHNCTIKTINSTTNSDNNT